MMLCVITQLDNKVASPARHREAGRLSLVSTLSHRAQFTLKDKDRREDSILLASPH